MFRSFKHKKRKVSILQLETSSNIANKKPVKQMN